MTTMNLKYFKAAGRAEVTRIMLHASGVDWKNTELAFPEWPAEKALAPLGSVPTLEVDGTVFCQSVALARFAAKKANLYPSDPFEALVVDEALDSISEIIDKLPFVRNDDQELKKQRKAFQADVLVDKFLPFLESRIQKFGKGTNFTSELSVADFALWVIYFSVTSGAWDHVDTDCLNAFPGIMTCMKGVEADEKMKSYLEFKSKQA